MIVKFSQFDCGEKPTLVLKNLDGTAIQTLGYAFNIEADLSYNEVSTLKFELPSTVDGMDVPGYNDVVGMRIMGNYLTFSRKYGIIIMPRSSFKLDVWRIIYHIITME